MRRAMTPKPWTGNSSTSMAIRCARSSWTPARGPARVVTGLCKRAMESSAAIFPSVERELTQPAQHPEVQRRGIEAVYFSQDVEERRSIQEKAAISQEGGDHDPARIFRIDPLALQVPGERRKGGVAEPLPRTGFRDYDLIDERRPVVRGHLPEHPVVGLPRDLAKSPGNQHGAEILHGGLLPIADDFNAVLAFHGAERRNRRLWYYRPHR